jgi:hypothetical protein
MGTGIRRKTLQASRGYRLAAGGKVDGERRFMRRMRTAFILASSAMPTSAKTASHNGGQVACVQRQHQGFRGAGQPAILLHHAVDGAGNAAGEGNLAGLVGLSNYVGSFNGALRACPAHCNAQLGGHALPNLVSSLSPERMASLVMPLAFSSHTVWVDEPCVTSTNNLSALVSTSKNNSIRQ